MFSVELYNSIFTNKIIDKITKYQVTPNGGNLKEFLDYTVFMIKGYSSYFEWDYEKDIDAKILVYLNYLAYIPYGAVGYKAMQILLEDISVEDFRYIKLQENLGEIFTKLSQEQKNYIKNYFYNYNCSQIETDSKKDIVSLFCRVSCELSSVFGENYDINSFKEKFLEIGNFILSDAEEYFSLSSAVFLEPISTKKELTKKELSRLKTFI